MISSFCRPCRHNRCDLFRKPLFRLRNFDTKDTVFRKFHTGFLFPPISFPVSPLFVVKLEVFRPQPDVARGTASHPLVWRSPGLPPLRAVCGSFLFRRFAASFFSTAPSTQVPLLQLCIPTRQTFRSEIATGSHRRSIRIDRMPAPKVGESKSRPKKFNMTIGRHFRQRSSDLALAALW